MNARYDVVGRQLVCGLRCTLQNVSLQGRPDIIIFSSCFFVKVLSGFGTEQKPGPALWDFLWAILTDLCLQHAVTHTKTDSSY